MIKEEFYIELEKIKIEKEAMIAENIYRKIIDNQVSYGESDFTSLIIRLDKLKEKFMFSASKKNKDKSL